MTEREKVVRLSSSIAVDSEDYEEYGGERRAHFKREKR